MFKPNGSGCLGGGGIGIVGGTGSLGTSIPELHLLNLANNSYWEVVHLYFFELQDRKNFLSQPNHQLNIIRLHPKPQAVRQEKM